MTTTQTIDGVPRHTLRLALAGIEYLALRADDIGTSSVQLAAELRALLDAPVPFPGYPPVPEDRKLPSARPQGEPAAWMCQRRTHESGRKFLPLISFDKWTNCPDDFDVWPLYRHPPEQPAPVAVVPDGYCIMPRQLTAENGAKALLLGEFKLLVTKECPECCELEEPVEGCSICDGEGEYGQKHTIPWDQIKFIYSKAVSGLAMKAESAKT